MAASVVLCLIVSKLASAAGWKGAAPNPGFYAAEEPQEAAQ